MNSRRDRKRRGRYRLLEIGIAAFAAGLVGASSCTVFSGLTVPDETGASSSGMTASGASGAGGDGAGSGGTSASSGSSGSGGNEPGGAITYLPLDQAMKACSFALKCPFLAESIALSVGVPVGNTNYSECLTWLAAPVPNRVGAQAQAAILKCVGGAPGCDEAVACLPVEKIMAADDDRCKAGSTCTIDHSTAVDCTANVAYHCNTAGFAPGSECKENNSVFACVKEGESCTDPGTATCEGDTLVSCKEPGIVRTPCSVAGLACSDPAGDNTPATCVGGGPCVAGTTECAGDRLLVCVNGVFLSFNCGNIEGGECFWNTPDKARCKPLNEVCTPSSPGVNICTSNGKKITVCVGGVKSQEPCLVGPGCGPTPDGTTDYCRP
jgi:hypothetical protein